MQLEETERTFCEFQTEHFQKLKQLLDHRIFEKDVVELEMKFEHHLKTVGDMIEIGENVGRVDTLIKEANTFQKLCLVGFKYVLSSPIHRTLFEPYFRLISIELKKLSRTGKDFSSPGSIRHWIFYNLIATNLNGYA